MNQRPFVSSRRSFVDTSGYYACTDPRSTDYAAAGSILGYLTSEHWRLYTTNYILAETHALLLSRLGASIAYRVLTALDHSGSTTVIRMNQRPFFDSAMICL